MPDISIVTISYNQARFLAEAIESVVITGENSVEHVIVDAGSTDGSREIISRFPGRIPVLEADDGPSDGLNKGFRRCTGDIMGYLNSDDRYIPGALNWVIKYFRKNPDVDLIFGAARIIDEQGRARLRKTISWNCDLPGISLGIANMVQPSTFFRRSLWERVKGFNVLNSTCWDSELAVDMLMVGAKSRVVYKVLSEFRYYKGTISSQIHSGDGERLRRFIEDEKRIAAKVTACRNKRMPNQNKRIIKFINYINPIRRSIEIFVR